MEKFKPTLVLFIVMLVAGLSLGAVNAFTKEPIAQMEAKSYQENLYDIFSENREYIKILDEPDGDVYDCYEVKDGSEVVGYAIETRPMGYNGAISIVTGVDTSGEIIKVKILDMEETPGLGALAKEDKYLDQFIGGKDHLNVTRNANETDKILSITSATVTSNAVATGVNAALDYFNANWGDK